MKHRKLIALASAGALALGAAACGDDDKASSGSGSGNASEQSSDTQNLSGSIRIDGSSTVQPFAEAAAELFQE